MTTEGGTYFINVVQMYDMLRLKEEVSLTLVCALNIKVTLAFSL